MGGARPKAVVEDKDGLWIAKFNRADDKWNQARVEHTMLVEDTFQSRDNWSYVSLVEELRRISEEPEKDAAELFRRMCFNALISNTDDHPRNHAFIAKDKNWRLSPAYDLTPFTPISNERRDLAMICGDQGRFANADNLFSQHARFLLKDEQAKSILLNMENFIKNNWYNIARAEGVSEIDCEKIASAFVYPGFRLSEK